MKHANEAKPKRIKVCRESVSVCACARSVCVCIRLGKAHTILVESQRTQAAILMLPENVRNENVSFLFPSSKNICTTLEIHFFTYFYCQFTLNFANKTLSTQILSVCSPTANKNISTNNENKINK